MLIVMKSRYNRTHHPGRADSILATEKGAVVKLSIYTLTHKRFDVPPDPMYIPLRVGSAGNEDFGYLRDDTGENISRLNCYFSELTGLYWIWKNVKNLDCVGTCHYRRYLLNEQGKVFTRREYEALLAEYDLITTRKVHLNNSYHYGFSANHNIAALDATGEVILQMYPEYHDTFVRLVNGPDTYFGNILVTRKELYDEYCEWLFSIFFEVQQRISLENGEDAYHKRVFGFISEFLLLVWTTVRGLKVYECKVGIIGEKAETREIKEQLAAYLAAHDIAGAEAYFLEQHKKRPDVLMEASDITGELRLTMQIIATADAEQRTYGRSFLEREDDLTRLIPLFVKLNRAVTNRRMHMETEEDRTFLQTMPISSLAVELAEKILPQDG
jgi:hypothetical protein